MRTTFRLAGLLALAFAVTLVAVPATDAAAAPACSTVSISGPSNVYAETSCVSPVWSAACSCPYGWVPNYYWTIDGTYAGSGSSASATYCPTTPAQTSTIQVQVWIFCGRMDYVKSKSVFVSQCDNSTFPVTCAG